MGFGKRKSEWKNPRLIGTCVAAALIRATRWTYLEIRARETQASLAKRTDAGDTVLQYLAAHGAPATRAAVAANIATPRARQSSVWPMTMTRMSGPNWLSRSRG